MKPVNQEQAVLWSLVKSMGQAEKQHFLKKFKIRLPDKSYPIYIRLFEWICRHKKADEKILLEDLGPELNKKNLSYTRHYLQNQLMEALGQLEEKRNNRAALIHNVPVIRKLFQQGQHIMAIRLWKQALRQARKLEDFVLIKLLKDEYLYFEIYYNKNNSYSDLLQIYNDRIVDTEEYFQITQLEELCFESILMRKKAHFNLSPGMKKQLQKLASHPLLQKQPDTNPFSRYHFWSLTHGIIHYLQTDYKSSVAYFDPLIVQWQAHPEHIAYRPETYLEVVYIYTYAAMHLGRFNEIEAVYHHSSNKHIKDRYNHYYFTVLKYLTFLRINHKKGNYPGVSKLLKKMKPHIPEWKEYLPPDLQRPLLMSVSISCFVLDDLDEADAYARQALLLFNDDMRADQARVTHLFLLLICYETKNEWIFRNQFQACYQYFYRNKTFSNFEKEIMSVLKKTFPYRRNDKNLSLLKTSLISLNKNNSNVKKEVCHIFNFPGWIASRIGGIAYRDWVRQKLDTL